MFYISTIIFSVAFTVALTAGQLANQTDPSKFPGPISAAGGAATYVTHSELYVKTNNLA